MKFSTIATAFAFLKSVTGCTDEIRFKAIKYVDSGEVFDICYPFTRDQDPMSPTTAESLRTFDDAQVARNAKGYSYSDITKKVFEAHPRMKLTHADDPSEEDRESYWQEVRELIAFYYLRINNIKSKEVYDQVAVVSPTPVNFVFDPNDTIDKSASHVFGDFPTTHVTDFILGNNGDAETAKLIGSSGYRLFNFPMGGMDPFIFQNPECYSQDFVPFVNAQVALGYIMAWSIQVVSPVAFAAKWSGGRARPHEIVWEIYKNGNSIQKYPAPDDVVRNIQKMNLSEDVDFTWNSSGSPGHPAHPAMHSAGSAISSWAQVILAPENLTEEKREMAFRYDWSVATFRSFGGVHYMSDNRAGLQLGRFILGENGPYFLGQTYGCNDETVAAITEYAKSKRPDVNWGTYFPHRWTNPILLSNKYGYTDLDVMAFVNDEGN